MEKATQNITDQFGRRHDYLRIALTERCNLRCFYCMPEEGVKLRPKSHFMGTEEVLGIAQQFVDLGVKKIRLTGGEPLVRKDAKEILLGLGKLPVELAITTNGILVDQYLDVFKEAGIKAINVSLDSLQPDKLKTITRRDYYERITSNIYKMVDEGFDVKVNTVVMRGVNDDEVIDFIEWTQDLPVQVRFIEFMPFDGNRWSWKKGVSFNEMMQLVHSFYPASAVEKIADKKNDTARNYRIKNYQGTFGIISSVTNPFCDSCNRIRLTADGKIKNCLFSNGETDLLAAYRQGEDIQSLILKTMWHKKAQRGGMDSFETFSNSNHHNKNRSMVLIGG